MILLITIHLPILLACLLPLLGGRGRVAGSLGWLAAVPAVVLAWSGLILTETEFPFLFLGSVLALDTLAGMFLALTATLWGIAGWFAADSLRGDPRRRRFQTFFLLSMAGNFGLIAAADLITFYGFFVLMTFAAYGLVIHQDKPMARRAGRVYLIMSLVGEVLLLSAMMLAVNAGGGALRFDELAPAIAVSDQRDWICALAFLGFGVKAGIVPLHFWLPLAHPVAPAPASAVLSGAMIKAGLIGWMNLLPLGLAALPDSALVVMALGFTAAFGAAVVGLCQADPKTILAYSSISQMGLITVLVGLALAQPELWPLAGPALALFALHHGLAKGALFLGAGLLPGCRGRARRLVWSGLWVPALAIASAPFTSGALAKYGLKDIASRSEVFHGPLVVWLLALSSVTTSLLLGRFLWRLGRGPKAMAGKSTGPGTAASAAFGASILAAALATHLARSHFNLALPAPGLSPAVLFDSLWPLALAGLLFTGFFRLAPARLQRLRIPAGDAVVVFERLLRALRRQMPTNWGRWWDREFLNIAALSDRIMAMETSKAVVNRIEGRLGSWSLVGVLVFALVLGMIALLLLF